MNIYQGDSFNEEEDFSLEEKWYINNDDDSLSDDDTRFCTEIDICCEFQYQALLKKEAIFLKHPLALSWGLIKENRNCYINGAIQLIARISLEFIESSHYSTIIQTVLVKSINWKQSFNLFNYNKQFTSAG